MTQKDKFIKAIEKTGYKVGIIDKEVNDLTDSQVKKIISNLNEETYTYKMIIKGVKLLVESETCDGEKDITIKHLSYYD